MAKHSDISWKEDHPGTLLSNSVEKADRMLKQAMSNPQEIAVEHVFNQIMHAENALLNAEQYSHHLDNVQIQQNKEQLELIKKQLDEVQEGLE